jgi:hypothetical protein
MRTMILRCLDAVPPEQCDPQTKSLGRSVSWTMRPLDDAALGHVVPDQCVLTVGTVFVKISYYVF